MVWVSALSLLQNRAYSTYRVWGPSGFPLLSLCRWGGLSFSDLRQSFVNTYRMKDSVQLSLSCEEVARITLSVIAKEGSLWGRSNSFSLSLIVRRWCSWNHEGRVRRFAGLSSPSGTLSNCLLRRTTAVSHCSWGGSGDPTSQSVQPEGAMSRQQHDYTCKAHLRKIVFINSLCISFSDW